MSEFDSIEEELKFMADCSDDRGDSETSLMFVRYLAHIRKLNAELAALKAGQGEAVAEVLSNRIGNDTATIDKALWPGTKLYTVPPAPADARLVPVELLERVCVDRCYPAGHTMSIRAIDELRALLTQSQEVKS